MRRFLHARHKWVALFLAIPFLTMLNVSCVHETKYSDESFYKDVAWGIMTGLSDIYNQNIAGTPSGAIDITASGPFGGTVHITGTTSYDQGNGIQTVHLKYDMSQCRVSSTSSPSDLNVDLTLNGVISEDGSWSSTYVSVSYGSDALSVSGVSQRGAKERDINNTTAFKANRTSSGISAELFGFKISW
ncbi:MAG: hypothetical protein NTX53_08420 [candidate division WOR-3 bacterium]|nr:hypothetical protein [candidate division WOR-3 bacterium]